MTRTVGFIGLGNMGGPMALNLVKAGFELVVHDINPARVAPLVAAGATVEASAEAVAAQCHRTICMVETTDQAESVILGEKGIIRSAKQGDIVLCMSTIVMVKAFRTTELPPGTGSSASRNIWTRRQQDRPTYFIRHSVEETPLFYD